MAQEIIETIQVTVKLREGEIMQAVFGNSAVFIGKLFDEYQKQIESYEKNGYIIISKDHEKFSFFCRKEVIY